MDPGFHSQTQKNLISWEYRRVQAVLPSSERSDGNFDRPQLSTPFAEKSKPAQIE